MEQSAHQRGFRAAARRLEARVPQESKDMEAAAGAGATGWGVNRRRNWSHKFCASTADHPSEAKARNCVTFAARLNPSPFKARFMQPALRSPAAFEKCTLAAASALHSS